jgi:hypothetical protein
MAEQTKGRRLGRSASRRPLVSTLVGWSPDILSLVHLETLKMGQTSSTETLVSYQKTTPGKNSKDFI